MFYKYISRLLIATFRDAEHEGTYLPSQGFELGTELGFELGIELGIELGFELGIRARILVRLSLLRKIVTIFLFGVSI